MVLCARQMRGQYISPNSLKVNTDWTAVKSNGIIDMSTFPSKYNAHRLIKATFKHDLRFTNVHVLGQMRPLSTFRLLIIKMCGFYSGNVIFMHCIALDA